MNARVLVLAALALLAPAACYVSDEPPPRAPAALGQPVQFTFGTLDGSELSSDTTRGRTTALLFVTTYDIPSQAEARHLREVIGRHKPRANAAIVMLEPPRSAPLAQVWGEQMELGLPIAMASPDLMSGESELGRVQGVPTLLVLDRRGRLRVRQEGALNAAQLEACLKEADAQ